MTIYVRNQPQKGIDDVNEDYFLDKFLDDETVNFVMLGTAFIDESADPTHDITFTASAFFIPYPCLKHFRTSWRKELERSGIRYFKNSECNSVDGQFLFLRNKYPGDMVSAKEAAQAIRSKLRKIIERTEFSLVVAVGMHMRDFKELNSDLSVRRNHRWESDYMASTYQMVIGLMAEHLRQLEQKKREYKFLVEFICDDGPQRKPVEKAYDAFKINFPEIAPYMADLTHQDDKKLAGLQAADLLAAETREMSKTLITNPDAIISPKKDGNIIFAVACADRDTLLRALKGERVWVTRHEIKLTGPSAV